MWKTCCFLPPWGMAVSSRLAALRAATADPQSLAFLLAILSAVAWKVVEGVRHRTSLSLLTPLAPRGGDHTVPSSRSSSLLPSSLSSSSLSSSAPLPRGREVKVLAACDVRDPWLDLAWHLLSTASHPRRVVLHLLLECSDPSLVPLAKVDAPELRPHVQVSVDAPARARHPARVVRRLAQRFVVGDERLVVVLADARARTVRGWDARLLQLTRRRKGWEGVVTAPTSDADGTARFVALRTRSNGTIARGGSHRFSVAAEDADGMPVSLSPHDNLVPTPCWCPELTAASPSFWLRGTWPDPRSESFVAQADALTGSVSLALPNVALLAHDEGMEDDLVDHDEGCGSHVLHRREAVGLSRRAADYEKIVKFGSAAAARIAVRGGPSA